MTIEPVSHARPSGPGDEIIVEVRDVKMYFPVTSGMILERKVGDVKAVDGVTFGIRRGETLGLVGESGSGKTTLGCVMVLFYRPTGGQVIFDGSDLVKLRPRELRRIRGRMQMIFQDPYASLDSRMSAASIIAEPLVIYGLARNRRERRERVEELMRIVGLNPSDADGHPRDFSDGQCQRIAIARALAVGPSFIVADEPVSALDVSMQAQIINLLRRLQDQFGLTYLFISHDLSVVRHISDRVAVMYLGRLMELANRQDLYENPLHPYTRALLSAVCVPDPILEMRRQRILLQGEIPSPLTPPSGCVFQTRCPIANQECGGRVPEWRNVGTADRPHWVACHRVVEGQLEGWPGSS